MRFFQDFVFHLGDLEICFPPYKNPRFTFSAAIQLKLAGKDSIE